MNTRRTHQLYSILISLSNPNFFYFTNTKWNWYQYLKSKMIAAERAKYSTTTLLQLYECEMSSPGYVTSGQFDILQPGRCWTLCGRGYYTFIWEDCEKACFCNTVCEIMNGLPKLLNAHAVSWEFDRGRREDKYLPQWPTSNMSLCLTNLYNVTDM